MKLTSAYEFALGIHNEDRCGNSIIYSRIQNATNDIIGNFRKLTDVGYMIVYLIRHTLKNKTTTHVAVFSSTQIFVC